jgi:hypothetical protein
MLIIRKLLQGLQSRMDWFKSLLIGVLGQTLALYNLNLFRGLMVLKEKLLQRDSKTIMALQIVLGLWMALCFL